MPNGDTEFDAYRQPEWQLVAFAVKPVLDGLK
jgi:hypothetical protein